MLNPRNRPILRMIRNHCLEEDNFRSMTSSFIIRARSFRRLKRFKARRVNFTDKPVSPVLLWVQAVPTGSRTLVGTDVPRINAASLTLC